MTSAEVGLDLQQTQLKRLSSVRAIAGVSIPAVVLNAAPPITIAVQTALLGSKGSTAGLAAFAAVGTCVGFVCKVFNFLVDGVSSKVGRCVGQRAWPQLGTHVQLSIRWSLLLGVAAVPLLLAAREPLCSLLLALSEEVQQQAAGYWLLRSLLVPIQMVAMAAAGVLQGFGRVRVNAALTSAAAMLEMGGSAAVLLWVRHQQQTPVARPLGGSSSSVGLLAMGCVTCACQVLLAISSLVCIVALPPAEARGRVNLLKQVFGFEKDGEGSIDDPRQPLLEGQAEKCRQLDFCTQVAAPAAPEGSECAAGSRSNGVARAAEPLHNAPQPQKRQQTQELGPRAGQIRLAREEGGAGLFDAATLEFLRDGRDMFLRSMLLQLTFFLALAAAARLGTTTLAAHSIIGQLWVVVSYAVDGFAAAGIVLGSRLFGYARDPQLRQDAKSNMARLTTRILLAGGVSGAAAGLVFQLAAGQTIAAFTSDPKVVEALHSGGAWAVLAAAQPLNGLLFVFDGLLLATQHFRFIRNYMALGFAAIFCPLLVVLMWRTPGLAAIWLAKTALNVWRLAGAAYLIFWKFLPHFGEEEEAAQAATGGMAQHETEQVEAGNAPEP